MDQHRIILLFSRMPCASYAVPPSGSNERDPERDGGHSITRGLCNCFALAEEVPIQESILAFHQIL